MKNQVGVALIIFQFVRQDLRRRMKNQQVGVALIIFQFVFFYCFSFLTLHCAGDESLDLRSDTANVVFELIRAAVRSCPVLEELQCRGSANCHCEVLSLTPAVRHLGLGHRFCIRFRRYRPERG
jgi:hypothetical protein